ncbi:hypothetical protein CH330_00995 [candidate division WOR-3 bacterium JGI_Cruoil_03_51_56]|uniref:Uncharacterized protein n=1 Tax=candidate division WOR-3 bacterium JGI_Cruoil_03_51_56 TaxID=1973747 RepID=A0A235BXW9_UNCW3|nr:MAG: hypothetical protein CH330_00995 [candidate division WOR-3 bacterium JGI_Cruoil_03_51_56]
MKKSILTAIAFGLGAFVILVSCDRLFPGSGDFEPSGTAFLYNRNIELLSITGKDRGFPKSGTFPLNITAQSKSSGQESDILPAGLLFRSTRNQVQHMLLLKDRAITVNTSSTQLELGTFCCNKYREIPRSPDTFEIGPVTDDTGLIEIIDLVRERDISGTSNLWMIQHAVWMVTDSTGLTQAYRDSIEALPQIQQNYPTF